MGEFRQEAIPTADGRNIVGRFFAPDGTPKGGVLIAAAMGVAQTFYAELAAWLAAQRYLVATFDYRGIGLSNSGNLRGLDVDVVGWAQLDCAAALDAIGPLIADKPLYWLGHSLGGQIVPLVPHWQRITKIITVATGSGYWRENAAPLNRRAWFLWYVVAPLAVSLFGYFPGKRLRMVGDLPAGVMKQWRRWCLNPEYLVGAESGGMRSRYAAVHTPIVSLSFTDDEFMSARNIDSMHGFYANAPRTMKRLAPRDVGVPRIGHFGFFRPEFREPLWRAQLLPELDA